VSNKRTQPKPTVDELDGIKPSIYARRWQILATLCASLLLVMIGNSSLNMALPTLAEQLNLTSVQLTWVVDIYSLVFASLLFTASAVADRYGRKTFMQLGLLVFLAGTVYAGFFAQSGIEVIVARGIMGVGGAMVMPTTLSILNNVFPRKQRARAIAIWSGIAGGGIALGSVMSGFLIEHYSWESVFVFSTVVGVIGFLFNQWLTPNSRDEHQTPIDWLGGILSTVGLLGLVYGIIEAPSHGLFHTNILISLAIGVIGIGSFIWWQRRTAHPMLDMKLFSRPAFSISALSVTLVFFALMGIFFSMSQLFQLVLGYGPFESSLRTLPLMMLMMVASPFVPNIVKKFGTRWTVTAGLTLVAAAFVIMSQWPVSPSYIQIIASMAVMMTGMALTMTPATTMMMSAVPRNRAGMGSAMNDTTRELGGALGVAVLGSVLGTAYSNKIAESVTQLPGQMQDIAENSLAGALVIAEKLGPAGTSLADAAKVAWMNGLSEAMLIAAGIVAVAAIITAIWLPHEHKEGQDDEELGEPIIEG
jgi:EmrB/QacA subfamily drug resistance transporter